VVEVLLGRGADVSHARNSGTTPLFFAAKNGHLAVVEALLGRGADVNQATTKGFTPLFIAAQKGILPVVEVLLYESKHRIFRPLQSLLNQTYSNWEWIIIDDSKTENTWNTLKVRQFQYMFSNATSFNKSLSTSSGSPLWNVGATGGVTTMQGMFKGATAFNNGGVVSFNWGDNTGNVVDMSFMFQDVETLQTEIKIADEQYKQYIQELGNEAKQCNILAFNEEPIVVINEPVQEPIIKIRIIRRKKAV
jgi:ankyrin repeat protein